MDEVVKHSLKETSLDELKEQADEVGYLTPREFAKLIGVLPQQVYAWIRKGVLSAEQCKCGRSIIQVPRALKTLEARSRVRGEALDTRPDG